MNDIIKDYMQERFSWQEWWKYGVLAPVILIILCLIAGIR